MAVHNFAYVCNSSGNTVTVLDLVAFTTTATIPVGTKPQYCAMAPSGNEVWVSNQNSNNVSVISTVSNTVVATIAGFNTPETLGFSNDGTTAYVLNAAGTIQQVTVATRVLGSLFSLTHPGAVIAMNPTANSMAAAESGGFVQQIAIPGGGLTTPISSPGTPSAMGYDATGVFMYMGDRSVPQIQVLSVPGNSLISTLTQSAVHTPFDESFTPDGVSVYFGTQTDVLILTTASNTITSTIATGLAGNLLGISITGDQTQWVVTSATDGKVSVYALPGNTLQHTFSTGSPFGVCTTPLPVVTEQIVMVV